MLTISSTDTSHGGASVCRTTHSGSTTLNSGMCCATLPPESTVGSAAIVRVAAEAGVAVENLTNYCAESPAREGLVLGYGAVRTADVEAGLARLATCW